MGSVVIQFVVFKDINAAMCMVEHVVRVAAHNQSSSHGVGTGSHDKGVEAISPSQSSKILT